MSASCGHEHGSAAGVADERPGVGVVSGLPHSTEGTP